MPAEDNNAARNGMLEKENREADRGTKGDASMDQTEVCQQVGRKIEGGKTDPRITLYGNVIRERVVLGIKRNKDSTYRCCVRTHYRKMGQKCHMDGRAFAGTVHETAMCRGRTGS